MSWVLADGLGLTGTAVNEDSRLMIAGKFPPLPPPPPLQPLNPSNSRGHKNSDTTAAVLADEFYFLTVNQDVFKSSN